MFVLTSCGWFRVTDIHPQCRYRRENATENFAVLPSWKVDFCCRQGKKDREVDESGNNGKGTCQGFRLDPYIVPGIVIVHVADVPNTRPEILMVIKLSMVLYF